MIKTLSQNEVKLCCNGVGCPTIRKINNDQYEVTDDNGNRIIVNASEMKLMSDAVTVLENKQQLICG